MHKKKLWGGRFGKGTHQTVERFSRSIHFDKVLAECDCLGSLHHIDVLRKAGILNPSEHARLKKGLNGLLLDIRKGSFRADESFEDIHSYIQYLLSVKCGKSAEKLHTCRSRNDQVVFDTKLYCLFSIQETTRAVATLQSVLLKLGKDHRDLILPGYTHLQHAMPVALKDYLGAYQDMLARDGQRLVNAFNNIRLTMGAGALAGTFIDAKKYLSAGKGPWPKKIEATRNAIDTVSDRDFVVEILSALSILGVHLSRLAEDLILWSSKEFDFIDIDEAFCTGSSLMPNKKNPDVLELIRGYAGRLTGNLVNVLVVLKGLPMSYNRDLQHDKEPLFDSLAVIGAELDVLSQLLGHVSFKKEAIAAQLADENLYATDLVDLLVQKGVPFRQAHHLIGTLIRVKIQTGTNLRDMADAQLKKIHPALSVSVVRGILNAQRSVQAKKSVQRKKAP